MSDDDNVVAMLDCPVCGHSAAFYLSVSKLKQTVELKLKKNGEL